MCQAMPRNRGFTVLELMVTVSVLAVVLGLAVPAFGSMIQDSRRAVTVNSFIHSVFLARSTAILSGETVSICRSLDAQTCSNGTANWQTGWIVFVNKDRDQPPVRDEHETLLAVFDAKDATSVTSNRVSYSFRPHTHAIVNGSIVFCDRRGSAQARAVIINSAGRPRVAKRDSENRPLRCPTG